MKSIYRLTLITALWTLGPALAHGQAAKAPMDFTLQQALDFALENNANLKNAKEAVTASEAKVGEVLASGLPQINANADLGNAFVIPTTFLPGDFFGKPGEYVGVKFGTQYNGRATINLDQMIFNGSYFVGLKASRTYTELSRKDLISTQTDLVAAIKKAYYSVLVNKERLSLVEKNFQRLDSLLTQTKVMYNNGFVEKIDVSRIQVQYNNIVAARKTAGIGLEISENLLKFQMGMPVTEKINLTDKLEAIRFQVLDEDFAKDFNYNNRVEYSKLEVNRALAELDIKNTRSRYLPRLDFYGYYGYSYGTSVFTNFVAFGENWRNMGTYGLRFSLPIFDGLMKSKQVQQRQVQLRQLDNAKEMTRNMIDMEQQQNTKMFNNYLETFRMQKENMDLAEEVYKVSLIKYQQGVGSNIEVINSDASYKEAQTNYYAALYDALISSVDLEKAYGKLLSPISYK